MSTPSQSFRPDSVSVRPVAEADLETVRRIFCIAFGTFLGVPDPENFWADREYIFTRWRTDPSAGLVAEIDGVVVASNFAAHWGSFAFFGPLTVRPDLWDRGIARKLLGPTMDLFAAWDVREAGLFTFAQSAKHVGLYQKYGFWPRFLTAITAKTPQAVQSRAHKFSSLKPEDQDQALSACRNLTGAVFDGLDVSREILGVSAQGLGDTLLIWDGDVLDALAICHCGKGSEAGNGCCYVKFAAVQPSPRAGAVFNLLLDACEALAVERGLGRVEAGVNLGRANAYRQMLERGYRTFIQGVAMQRPDSPGFNRPDVYVIDDWR